MINQISRLLLASAVTALPLYMGAAPVPEMHALMLDSESWTDATPYGIYRLPFQDGDPIELVNGNATGEMFEARGGAVYANGKYFTARTFYTGGKPSRTIHYVYDTETWELIDEFDGDPYFQASDMAYDPSSDTVYGSFAKFKEGTNVPECYSLGKVDISTGIMTRICDLDAMWRACAFDDEGNLYAVRAGETLCDFAKIDKTTGAAEVIAANIPPSYYLTTGTIDNDTRRFYYAICMDEGSAMCAIDLDSGKFEIPYEFPGGEAFSGMYIPIHVPEEAPSPVSGLDFDFRGPALNGNVVFEMPSYAKSGDILVGELSYRLKINGRDYTSGKGAPGATMKVPVSVSAPGNYTVVVTASNLDGESFPVPMTQWIGNDYPCAPAEVAMTYEDGIATVRWDAVTLAEHDGYLNAADVTYTVVRQPDGVRVVDNKKFTLFSEPIPEPEDFIEYYYTVVATHAGLSAEEVKSNAVRLGHCTIPYEETFTEADSFEYFTVLDANNDGYTWKAYNKQARISYNVAYKTVGMDDWLITPPMRLEAGQAYEFSMDAYTGETTCPERVEVYFGTSPNVGSMTRKIISATDLTQGFHPQRLKGEISVTTAGNYYFGIHACSDPDSYMLYVDNISVVGGPDSNAPDAVGNLSVTPDAAGANSVTVSFTLPSKTVGGAALSAISKVEILRDGTLIHEIASPAVGGTVSYVDDNNLSNGLHTYSVRAYNQAGIGRTVDAKVFVGINYPNAPSWAKAREISATGEVNITWSEVETDVDGHPVNGQISYSILEVNGNERNTIATGLKELSYTYKPDVNTDTQQFISYTVFAETSAGLSASGTSTGWVIVGNADCLPYHESFSNEDLSTVWGTSQSGMGQWYTVSKLNKNEYNPEINPQDGDSGMLAFVPIMNGDQATVESAKIDLSGAKAPVLMFHYYAMTAPANELEVMVNDGENWTSQKKISVAADNGKEGWRKVIVPLSAYRDGVVRIAFVATSNSSNAKGYVAIDNVYVRELYAHNLAAVSIDVPSKVVANELNEIGITVENTGTMAASGYSVEVYRNGSVVAIVEGSEVEPEGRVLLKAADMPHVASGPKVTYHAEVVYEYDEDETDNVTSPVTVRLSVPKYPVVTDLTAEKSSGKVVMAWSEPNITDPIATEVTEDFEDYESFAIDDLGEWTMYDCDGAVSEGIQGIDVPHLRKDPFAYMVMDRTYPAFNDSYEAHSGSKYLAAFFSLFVPNDDWLVSPLLWDGEQDVSFWARSYYDAHLESFEFLISSTGKETDDFSVVDRQEGIMTVWTNFTYTLPAGTKYFAIRCVSDDKFAFFVDDITYTPAPSYMADLKLLGYNVYRNGERLNDKMLTSTSFVDGNPIAGDKNYNVSVVYEQGESALSNTVGIDISSLDEIASDGVNIGVVGSNVVVYNASGRQIEVFGIDGTLVFAADGAEKMTIPLSTGIYIVKAGNKTAKVGVR